MASKYHKVLDHKRQCDCGKGLVFYYNNEWENDFPPFEETRRGATTTNCPDNCENLKKD